MARKEKIEMMMIMQGIDTDEKNTIYKINHPWFVTEATHECQDLLQARKSYANHQCRTAAVTTT